MAGIELIALRWGHEDYRKVFQDKKENAANGFDVKTEFYNASDKVIKYLTFTYIAYNKVGDVITCTTTGKTVASCKVTGPMEVNERAGVTFDAVWYNPTLDKVEIKEVAIEYMDGSTETVAGADLVSIYEKPVTSGDLSSFFSSTFNKNSVYYEKRGKREEAKAAEEKAKRNKMIGIAIGIAFAAIIVISMVSSMLAAF